MSRHLIGHALRGFLWMLLIAPVAAHHAIAAKFDASRPATLTAALERAASHPLPSLTIDTGGAARSAELIAGMIGPARVATDCLVVPAGRATVAR